MADEMTEEELTQLEREKWFLSQKLKEEFDLANQAWRDAREKLDAVVRKRPKKLGELKYAFAPCKECGERLAYSELGHNRAWECSKDLLNGTQEHQAYPFAFFEMKIDYRYTEQMKSVTPDTSLTLNGTEPVEVSAPLTEVE